MKQLEGMDRALATTTKAVGMLDAAFAATSLTLGALNTELGITSTHLYTVAAGAGMSAQAMRSMNVSAGASNRHFTRMNSQLQNISTHAASAQRAMVGLGMAMPVGGGGGGRGGGHGGGMGFFGGGLGEWMNKSMIAMIGFDIMKAGMHPSMEYAQQQQGLQSMGLNGEQMGRAERQAADIQRANPATNRTENLKTIKELYGIFRRFDEAVDLAPDFAKFEVALQGVGNRIPSLKGHESSFAQAVAKSAETMGRLSPADFRDFMNKSLQSYESTGGLVTPLHTAQAIKFSRSARYGKSDDWTFGVLSFLLEESALGKGGGGSRGVGPLVTQIDKTFAQGHMDKRLMQGLANMGLFEGQKPGTDAMKQGLVTSTISTGVTGKIKGMDLLIKNPFLWASQVALPAMLSKEFKGMSPEAALKAWQNMPGKDAAERQANQKAMILKNFPGMQQQAGDAMVQFFMNQKQIELFVENTHKAMSVTQAYNLVMDSTAMKAQATGQQMYLLSMQLGTLAGPAIGFLLDGFRGLLSIFTDLDKTYPGISSAFMEFNTSLFAAEGPLRSLARSVEDLYQHSMPLISLFDKLGELAIKTMGDSATDQVRGIGKGIKNATRLQDQTGIPAWLTAIPLAVIGDIDEVAKKDHKRNMKKAMDAFDENNMSKKVYGPGSARVIDSMHKAKITQYLNNTASGKMGTDAVNVVINFNGAVNAAEHLVHQVKQAVMTAIPGAMARAAHKAQSIIGSGGAGGLMNNPGPAAMLPGRATGTTANGNP
jgi:hypothetical protein